VDLLEALAKQELLEALELLVSLDLADFQDSLEVLVVLA